MLNMTLLYIVVNYCDVIITPNVIGFVFVTYNYFTDNENQPLSILRN